MPLRHTRPLSHNRETLSMPGAHIAQAPESQKTLTFPVTQNKRQAQHVSTFGSSSASWFTSPPTSWSRLRRRRLGGCPMRAQARTATYSNLSIFPEAQPQKPMENRKSPLAVVRFVRAKRDTACIGRETAALVLLRHFALAARLSSPKSICHFAYRRWLFLNRIPPTTCQTDSGPK